MKNLILTEKYRPDNFEEFIFPSNLLTVWDKLKKDCQTNTAPSIILYSSPGTGKTTFAQILSKENDLDLKRINSSEERGIDIIRDKVKMFVSCCSSNEKQRCVHLDEADGMTPQAQDSLRNLMEEFSDNSFFIFTCNNIEKIIKPIRSRCVEICFNELPKEKIIERLKYICEQEKLEYDIESIVDYYYPDVRAMIKFLQLGYNKIDEENKLFLDLILKKDIKKIYEVVLKRDVNVEVFIKYFFKYVYDNYEQLGQFKAIKIVEKLADTEKHENLGINLNIVFLSNIIDVCKFI